MPLKWKVLTTKKWQAKRALFIASPLLLLILDLVFYPIIFEARDASSSFSAGELIRSGLAYLGTFKGHKVYASLDDMDDLEYLSFAEHSARQERAFSYRGKRTGNALAISIVPIPDGWGGSLLSSLMRNLSRVSSIDHDSVIDLLQQAKSLTADILWYDLNASDSRSASFPIDHLLLLKLDNEKKESYQKRMHELVDLVGREQISLLVVPCLGRSSSTGGADATNRGLSCSDTYEAVFESLNTGESPDNIYLSFYKQWTESLISKEAGSLERAWKTALSIEEKKSGVLPVMYQADIRLMLVSLFICLLVCSRQIELKAKTFVILCLSFIPAAMGLQAKASPLISSVVAFCPGWVIKASLLAVLSFGYVFFASLDYGGVFKSYGQPNRH